MSKLNFLRVLVAAFAIAPTIAFAHTGIGGAHDFLHGFVHPIGGLDHVLAMVAVGVIAVQLGGRALWAVPASFVFMMAVAGGCGMTGIAVPHAELGIALSLVVLGAVIAYDVHLSVGAAAALVALFAFAHGYAHGMEMPDNLAGIAFACGFILATALLHGIGIGLGFGVRQIRTDRALQVARTCGGAVAIAGLVTLAGVFAS